MQISYKEGSAIKCISYALGLLFMLSFHVTTADATTFSSTQTKNRSYMTTLNPVSNPSVTLGDIIITNDSSMMKNHNTDNPDWLSGWIYRKNHIINSATGAGTNYQVRIRVNYGSGIDSGENVYLGGKGKTDFGDVRFTDDDETTLLDYWMQEKVDGSYVIFWIEVADDLGTTNRTIYTYYGKSDATTTSNGDNTFIFFDDFSGDLSKWQRQSISGVYPRIESNYLRCGGGSTGSPYGWTCLGSSTTYTAFQNNAIEFRYRVASDGICEVSFRGNYVSNTGYKGRSDQRSGEGQSFLKPPYRVGVWGFITGSDGDRPSINVWYTGTITAYNTTFKLYRNDVLKRTASDIQYSGPGQISLQNHYGSYTDYDWVAVRKFTDPEPGHGTWGNEDTLSLTITATAVGGGVITPSGSVNVKYGTNQLFTINPNTGYHLDSLIVDNVNHGDDSTNYTFTNVQTNHIITAYFSINTYTITASAIGSGIITPSGIITVSYGGDTTFTISSNTGYHLDSLKVDGVNHGDDSTRYRFTNVTTNHTITAYFSINYYTLAINIDGTGSVDKNPNQPSYSHGTAVNLTALPGTGWHFMGWSGDTTSTANPITITMNANKNITATFAIDTFSIVSSTSSGGTISPLGTTYITYGSNQLFTFGPNTGYHLHSLVVDDINHGDDSTNYTFTNVQTNHIITAYFSINTYTITATASSGGTISPAGVITLNYGDDTTFIITPNTGYHLDSLVVDNQNHGDDSTSYKFTNVTTNHTITAYFSINTYTLTVNTIGNGTVTKTPDQPTYNHGTWVKLQENPATGWHFMSWSGDLTGSNNPDSVLMTSNKNVTATFAIDTFNIVSSTSSGGTISPLGTTYVTCHSNQLYTFGPNTGYHLDSLVVDDVNHGDDSIQYQFISVTADHTIRVYYSINTYTLTVNTSGSGEVTKTPEQVIYNHGTWVKLQANPVTGWHFVNWTGNLTGSNNPDSVYMDDNKSITANFAINTYTLNVTTIGLGTVTKNPDQPFYNHGTNVILTALPGPTRSFLTWSGDTTTIANPITLTMNSNKNITATFVATPSYRDVGVTAVVQPADTIIGCRPFNPEVVIYNYGANPEICTVDVKIWRFRIKVDSICHISNNPNDSVLMYSSSIVTSVDTGANIVTLPTIWNPNQNTDIYWISSPSHHIIRTEVNMDGDQNPANDLLRKVFILKARSHDIQAICPHIARGGYIIQSDTIQAGIAYNPGSVVYNSPFGPRAFFRSWLKIYRVRNNAPVYSRYTDLALNSTTYRCLYYSTGWVPMDTGLYKVSTWIEFRPGVDSNPNNNSCNRFLYVRYSIIGNTQSEEVVSINNYSFSKCYYNPLQQTVSIRWQIPVQARLTASIYDVKGRKVKILENKEYEPGSHYTTWNCTDEHHRKVSMGVYYITLSVNDYSTCRKIVVMR